MQINNILKSIFNLFIFIFAQRFSKAQKNLNPLTKNAKKFKNTEYFKFRLIICCYIMMHLVINCIFFALEFLK